jgi:hypothetical protein
VIFSGLIGWAVWQEPLGWISGVGILMVCVGGILSILLAPDAKHSHGIMVPHGYSLKGVSVTKKDVAGDA